MSQVPITIMVDQKQLLALEYEATQKGFDIPQKLQEQFEKMHEKVSDKTKSMIDFLESKGVFDGSQPVQSAPRRTRAPRASAAQIVNGETPPKEQLSFGNQQKQEPER